MHRIRTLMVLVLLLILPINAHAAEPLQIDYYGTEYCVNCKQAEQHFKKLEEIYGESISISRHMLSEGSNEDDFLRLTTEFNVETIVPTIHVNGSLYQGVGSIEDNLENLIKSYIQGDLIIQEKSPVEEKDIQELQEKKFDKLSLMVIVGASLIDGVNPCAIAMLLFFMSLLTALNDRKKILLAGLSYSFAIFLTYLLIGVGLLKVTEIMLDLSYMTIVLYLLTILICVSLVIMDTQDYMALKRGKEEDVKNQLPKGVKHRIHNLLRKQAASKWIVLTTFFTGVAVALLEFSCTGQVYIPTISFILSQGNALALIYLIIYNLVFVLPIVAITLLVYKSNDIMQASNLLVENRKNIKLVSIVFYTGVIAYFVIRLIKII